MKFAKYQHNNRTAIELVDAEDGEPIAIATTNLVNEQLAEGEIAIKDYFGNEGMLHCLVNAKIVSLPSRYVSMGFVQIPICKILIKQ